MSGPATPATERGSKGDAPDMFSGALFIGFGVLGLWLSRDLPVGTLAQMSAGYLPRMVCGLLILVGFAVFLHGMRKPGAALEGVSWRPLLVISIAVIGFAYAVTHLGFVIASLWLILVGSLADRKGNLWQVLLLAGGLTAFGSVVFVFALGVQVPLWPN
jgi:hypothetical protein